MAYIVHIITLVAIYIIVGLSFAIPVGYTGLLNLGHVGLLAIGAYTAAILTTNGFSFWLALPAAAIVTGIVGFLLSIPTRRIKGDYYALMTLGFMFVVNAVILNGGTLTGGPFGISGIGRPQEFLNYVVLFLDKIFPQWEEKTPGLAIQLHFFVLSLVAMSLVAAFVWKLVSSPFGRALQAVRDDELVAESLGKPIGKLRMVSLTVSAVLVGIAGALLAPFLQFINAQVFWLDNAVWILAALVIGGLASFRGAILGTVILFGIFESIRFLPLQGDLLATLLGPLRLIIFSLLLLFVVLFRPKGIWGRAQLE